MIIGTILPCKSSKAHRRDPQPIMKPFAPAFEDVDNVRIGWLKDAQDQIRSRKSDARFK